MKKKYKKIALILHDIRSVYNVGSIFRTADASGVSKIYLTGYTPTPKDRFGKDRKDLAKVALGAEKSVDWQQIETTEEIIEKLKKEGFYIIALEQAKNSVDYKKVNKKIHSKSKITLILGSEKGGIPENILKISDIVAEIPMKGKKESLNVSVSAGIVLFRILDI